MTRALVFGLPPDSFRPVQIDILEAVNLHQLTLAIDELGYWPGVPFKGVGGVFEVLHIRIES